jgi:hypothetical protein
MVVMVGSEVLVGALGLGAERLTSDMFRCLTCARRSALWNMHVYVHAREGASCSRITGTAVLHCYNVAKSSFLIFTMQHGVKITTVRQCFRPVTNMSLTTTTS